MKSNSILLKLIFSSLFINSCSFFSAQVTMNVNTSLVNRKNINPLIYGLNGYVYDVNWGGNPWQTGLSNHGGQSNLLSMNPTSWRFGGNAASSYNWENGANNSGNDYFHENSQFQSFMVTSNSPNAAPSFYATGAAIMGTQTHALGLNAKALIQLPMAGYVAADVTGPTCGTPNATPSRWKKVINTKPTPFSLIPDLTDSLVYVDEEINFLKNQFGDANAANGVKFYQMDNEVGLWAHYKNGGGVDGTHSVLHPYLTTCNEIINKSKALAAVIKTADPAAKVFTAGRWGYAEAASLWNIWDGSSHQPSDWNAFNVEPFVSNNTGNIYRYNKMTWQNAFLNSLKQQEIAEGSRKVDVLAIHYYPAGIANNDDRVQAPRSLWDSTYVENSWITAQGNGILEGRGLNMLPLTQRAIADFYPGTKLAITEYDFGGRNNIAGTIAQADALGIFGKNDIYFATYFGIADQYISSAFRLFRNYDGNNSTYGEIGLSSSTNNVENTSIYASLKSDSNNELHLVLINKANTSITANVNINGTINYDQIMSAHGLTEADGNTNITSKSNNNSLTGGTNIIGNSLGYVMAPKSVYHLVVRPNISGAGLNNGQALETTVFPNPSNYGKFMITANERIESIQILNANGEQLWIKTNVNATEQEIDLQLTSNGIYFLKIEGAGHTSVVKKIVIQK